MNNTPSSPRSAPRLICRTVRLWCSLTDSANPGHAVSCPECRAYFRSTTELDVSLRREAAAFSLDAGHRDERALRDTLRAVRHAEPERARPRHWLRALTTGIVTAALAVAWVHFNRPPVASSPTVAGQPPPNAEAAVLADTVQGLSTELVHAVIPAAGAMVASNPLQQEFDSIYADARSALGFLALNFLPVLPETSAAPAPIKSRI